MGVPPTGPGCEATPSAADASSQSRIPNAWPLIGYAPGNYTGRCATCGETKYDLAKRAWQCLECAASQASVVIEKLAARELELLRKVESYGNLLAYFASDAHDVKPAEVRRMSKKALAASAGEAGTAETTKIGSVHEHATLKGDAQND